MLILVMERKVSCNLQYFLLTLSASAYFPQISYIYTYQVIPSSIMWNSTNQRLPATLFLVSKKDYKIKSLSKFLTHFLFATNEHQFMQNNKRKIAIIKQPIKEQSRPSTLASNSKWRLEIQTKILYFVSKLTSYLQPPTFWVHRFFCITGKILYPHKWKWTKK